MLESAARAKSDAEAMSEPQIISRWTMQRLQRHPNPELQAEHLPRLNALCLCMTASNATGKRVFLWDLSITVHLPFLLDERFIPPWRARTDRSEDLFIAYPDFARHRGLQCTVHLRWALSAEARARERWTASRGTVGLSRSRGRERYRCTRTHVRCDGLGRKEAGHEGQPTRWSRGSTIRSIAVIDQGCILRRIAIENSARVADT